MTSSSNPAGGRTHAIVIGGSIGGLLAARVLCAHFQRVTLIERDHFPEVAGENRRGVPQGRHTHGLLASGGSVLAQLFPGLMEDLERCGGVPCDPVKDGYWFHEGASLAQVESGMRGLLVSRPLLEGFIRDRVLALPNLKCIQDSVVDGLFASEPDRVTGVRIGPQVIESDLVVDASGRGSHLPQWLATMAYPAPAEDRVEVSLAYSTRRFRRVPEHLTGKTIAIVPPTPAGKRGGVMIAQEGGTWTVTLISHFRQAPPLDLDGFIEYARSLPSPLIYDVVSNAEPVGEGVPARFPASVRRRYENLEKFPKGLLVLGDAICSFNPIYGQGMSVSALESLVLDEVLQKDFQDLAKSFFQRAARVVDTPWSIAVGNDLRMPEAKGTRTLAGSFINWYVSRLHRAAHSDEECSLAFHRVANLLEPPPSLMRPGLIAKVMLRGLFNAGQDSRRIESSNQRPHDTAVLGRR